MNFDALLQHYGLAALFVGAGLEGEAAVIAGGLLAHQGLVPLPGAMLAAAAGSFTADQGWFTVGRRLRDRPWVERLRHKAAFARALRALERYPRGFIFAFRFIYGLRTVSPIAIGTSRVPARLFLPVNAVAAAIWGVTFSAVGYLFGDAFERFVGRLHPHGRVLWGLVAAVVIAGLLLGLWHWQRGRRA